LAELKAARRALGSIKPDQALAHNTAAIALYRGDLRARADLERMGAHPPEALVNLGLLAERQGDLIKAVQLWQLSGHAGKVREWIEAARRFLGTGGLAAGGGVP
jgi:hypothetical protein